MEYSQPIKSPRALIADLPLALGALRAARRESSGATDFEILRRIAESDPAPLHAITELRHLLAISFSHYQLNVRNYLFDPTWAWHRFLAGFGSKIFAVCSFNYDVNIEIILEHLGMPTAQMALGPWGSRVPLSSIPIVKPHGSINYSIARRSIFATNIGYPLNYYSIEDSYPVELLPLNELVKPRITADLVLPGETNRFYDIAWSQRPLAEMNARLAGISHLIIAGISYWDVDRSEIDRIIDAMPKAAQATIVNPSHDAGIELLKSRLMSRIRRVDHIDSIEELM